MKKARRKVLFALVCGILLCGYSAVQAAIIWDPTNDSVNFFTLLDISTVDVAIFDDNYSSNSDAHLNIIWSTTPYGISTAKLEFNAANNSVSNGFDEISLTDNNWYWLAISFDGGLNWQEPAAAFDLKNDQYLLTLTSDSDDFIIQIDSQIVPIPAPVLLFGSGLIGLVAFRRRTLKRY
jgi:hypothetical protein